MNISFERIKVEEKADSLGSIKIEVLSPAPEGDDIDEDLDVKYDIDIDNENKLLNKIAYDHGTTEDVLEVSSRIKIEVLSPKLEQLDDSEEEIDIEYNIDIGKEYKSMKNEMFYMPNKIKYTEVETGLNQYQNLDSVSNTILRRPDQSVDCDRDNSFEEDSEQNTQNESGTIDNSLLHDTKWSKPVHGLTTEKGFTCDNCKKSFTQKGNLLIHMRCHSGERPFSCKICKKSFTQKQNLLRHMHCHTGEKPFTCNICEKSFTDKSNLSTHMRSHTGEKPFSCNICRKSFAWKKCLLIHARTHF